MHTAHGYTPVPGTGTNERFHDSAILRLFNPLGERVGWMGSYWSSDDEFYTGRESWLAIGYPGNTPHPSTEFLIPIEDVDESDGGYQLECEPFSSPGWSGGPLWGWIDDQPKFVGVLSGNEDEWGDDHSIAAGGDNMVGLVKYAWSNWS